MLPGKGGIEERGAYNGNGERFPKVCKGPPVRHDIRKIFTPVYGHNPYAYRILAAKGKKEHKQIGGVEEWAIIIFFSIGMPY